VAGQRRLARNLAMIIDRARANAIVRESACLNVSPETNNAAIGEDGGVVVRRPDSRLRGLLVAQARGDAVVVAAQQVAQHELVEPLR